MTERVGNGLEGRVRALEIWRAAVKGELDRARDFRAEYGPAVDRLADADRLTKELATVLGTARKRRWSAWERLFAVAVVAAAVGGFAIQLAGHL